MIWFGLYILPVLYFGMTVWLVLGWIRRIPGPKSAFQGSISILIPCRNEEDTIIHLLHDLDQQDMDPSRVSVFVIDDHSEDKTVQVVRSFRGKQIHPVLLELQDHAFGKKAALTAAIEQTGAEIILCTDADCRVGPAWVSSMSGYFSAPEVQMVSGPVKPEPARNVWGKFLDLEFLSLIAVGGSSINQGFPNMCNGANLAYRRSAVLSSGGYSGHMNILSGDDEMLMQAIHRKWPGGIRFNKDQSSIVTTPMPASFGSFLDQRLRWASKAGHYKNPFSMVLPWFILVFNGFLLSTPLLVLAGISPFMVAYIWIIKILAETLFFTVTLPFFRRSSLLELILPMQLLHPLYIVGTGLLSLVLPYRWKGRQGRRVFRKG